MTEQAKKPRHPWRNFVPGWLAGKPIDVPANELPSYQDKPRGTANRRHGRIR